MTTEAWTAMQDLKNARYAHGCAKLGDKIIVAGGNDNWKRLDSTEIFDIATGVVRYGGQLSRPRQDFQMVTIGGHYQRILAMGGITSGWTGDYDLDTIEEWDEESSTWSEDPIKLENPKHR